MSLSRWIMVEISSTSRKWKLLAERQRHPSILPLMVYSCHLVILLLCLFVFLLVWQLVSFSAFLLCNCCYHLNNSRQHHRQLQPMERTQQQQQVRLLYEGISTPNVQKPKISKKMCKNEPWTPNVQENVTRVTMDLVLTENTEKRPFLRYVKKWKTVRN